MFDQLGKALGDAVNGIVAATGAVLIETTKTAENAAVGIASTVGGAFNPLLGSATEVVKSALELSAGAIDGATKEVGKNLEQVIDGTGNAVTGSVNALGQASGLILDAVGKAFWPPMPAPPAKTVFVVHGRNPRAWHASSEFLKALELSPQNFDTLVERGNLKPPFTVQDVLKRAFALASAVVVLFTPDETAELAHEFGGGTRCQSRANVFVEAGMALGLHLERTILVTFKGVELPTDVSGYVAVNFDGDDERMRLARRSFRGQLKAAGVSLGGGDAYLSAGKFHEVVRTQSKRGQPPHAAQDAGGLGADAE